MGRVCTARCASLLLVVVLVVPAAEAAPRVTTPVDVGADAAGLVDADGAGISLDGNVCPIHCCCKMSAPFDTCSTRQLSSWR